MVDLTIKLVSFYIKNSASIFATAYDVLYRKIRHFISQFVKYNTTAWTQTNHSAARHRAYGKKKFLKEKNQ